MAKSEEKGRALAAPPGERIYAVGDIHGCDDKLSRLMHAIATDLEDAPGVTARFVFLGDYVDRAEGRRDRHREHRRPYDRRPVRG